VEIIRAGHSGFCFGVDRAINLAFSEADRVDRSGKLYTCGHLIHNSAVVERLAEKGVGMIGSLSEAQPGDLVCFYGHIGIYIGNNQIVHAGDGGVGIADLDNAYFVHHYMCARRVVLTDPAGKSPLPAAGVTENINGSYWRESSQTNGSGNSFFPIFQG
jgi:hypothetical protein